VIEIMKQMSASSESTNSTCNNISGFRFLRPSIWRIFSASSFCILCLVTLAIGAAAPPAFASGNKLQ
jgi:hypothetical protein